MRGSAWVRHTIVVRRAGCATRPWFAVGAGRRTRPPGRRVGPSVAGQDHRIPRGGPAGRDAAQHSRSGGPCTRRVGSTNMWRTRRVRVIAKNGWRVIQPRRGGPY